MNERIKKLKRNDREEEAAAVKLPLNFFEPSSFLHNNE